MDARIGIARGRFSRKENPLVDGLSEYRSLIRSAGSNDYYRSAGSNDYYLRTGQCVNSKFDLSLRLSPGGIILYFPVHDEGRDQANKTQSGNKQKIFLIPASARGRI